MVTVNVHSTSDDQVVIRTFSPSQTILWGYDKATGIMNMISKVDYSLYAPIETTLKLRP